MPRKRARVSRFNLQIGFCQVYGCNKDLSSSKDYYKRHKVCESHTKTAKVIVNGIEQRFCQQCSRFHLVAEFDESKRSCRKRLAGHNERRRKPQVGTSERRYLQPYNGSIYPRTTSAGTSFIFRDISRSDFPNSEKLVGIDDWFKPTEVGNATITPMNNGHFSLKPTYDIGARNAPYPFDIRGFYGSPNSFLPRDLPAMDRDSTTISNSGCAHSLLSSARSNFSGFSMLSEQCQAASPILTTSEKNYISWERHPTIGFSSHWRIKRFMLINPENNSFCYLLPA